MTNLRMERNDYMQAKIMAGEMGMSLNQYFNYLATNSVRSGAYEKKTKTTFSMALRDLVKSKSKFVPLGLSDEDETIYGD